MPGAARKSPERRVARGVEVKKCSGEPREHERKAAREPPRSTARSG